MELIQDASKADKVIEKECHFMKHWWVPISDYYNLVAKEHSSI